MGLFIGAAVLLLVAAGLWGVRFTVRTHGKFNALGSNQEAPPWAFTLAASLPTVAGALMLVFSAVFTVPNNHAGVEVLFGRITAAHSEGIHLKNPLSSVYNIPGLQQESTYSASAGEGEVRGNDALEAVTADQARVDIDATILWSLDLSEAQYIFREYRTLDQVRARLLRPTARDNVRDCVARHIFQDARTSGRQVIADCSRDAINTETADRGLVVHSVQIRGMAAQSTEFQAGIDRKLVADQAAQEALYRQQQAQVDAETARITAEGEARAAIERAKGEAEANQRVEESLTPQLVEYRKYEFLSKAGNTVWVIEGQSPPIPVLPVTSGLADGEETADQQ